MRRSSPAPPRSRSGWRARSPQAPRNRWSRVDDTLTKARNDCGRRTQKKRGGSVTMAESDTVLDFWLTTVGAARWYKADPALDAEVAARFEGMVAEARRGAFSDWILNPRSGLALILLLDQFPRHIWRDTAAAFESDARAMAKAKRAMSLGHDMKIAEPERQFFYLPLMHSESQ
ncbi:MAG: hypothetical protein CO163_05395, partial [Rhodobacterales bacterium CG_4_9_14_3_um_filter_71_31]